MKIHTVLRWMWLWPPYLGAGIHVHSFSRPINNIVVRMHRKRRNINYVGTHFGGNLYSMCDPWFMFILMEYLGKDFIVWDKSARIEFVQPGRGMVEATFHIPQERLEAIRQEAAGGTKVLPVFCTEIIDEKGDCVAKVEKELYIRKKSVTNHTSSNNTKHNE